MAQPAAPQTGQLQEEPLDFFTKECTKLKTFKRQFNMYKGLNANHEIMQSPYLHTMLTLTFIKGPLVEDWAANQVEILEEKVTCQVNPMLMTDNALWMEFITIFNANFSNVVQKQHTMSQAFW
jgi:hypothetical protein